MTRALVVAGHGLKLRVRKRSLIVEGVDGGKMVVPLSEIDRVVVATSGVSITSSAVRIMARHGVGLVFLTARGDPIVSLEPPWINATASTRLAQYQAYMQAGLQYAKSIVEAKLRNQAGLLKSLARRTGAVWLREDARKILEDAIPKLHAARTAQEVREAEATAARHYWGGIARLMPGDLGFQGRDPGSRDPVNIILNYVYGILYSEVFRALVVHGLDPYIGFLHALKSGSPSLVFDYADMFKPSAGDSLVYRMLAEDQWRPYIEEETGLLGYDSRVHIIREAYHWLKRIAVDSRGQAEPLEKHIALYARRLSQSLKTLSPYNGFVEQWRP